MYPKNAASPQRIAVGAVVQISDGAVQTSGVSVSVLPQGGAAGAGGGTIAYEQGVVHYLPTQAETNYASFIVIAYKTGCIPATITVVTTASAVAGYAGVDWGTINAPTSTVGLTNTTVGTVTTAATVTTLTNLPSIPANWLTAAGMDATASSEIADQVWDEILAGHAGVGSTGAALSAAGGSGDPWATALPGAYGAGTAGQIVGTYVDAAVSTRATQTSVDAIDDFLDTEVAAIKAKTDNLPAAPAAVGDIPTALQNADAMLNRDMSAVSDTNARSPLNALRFLRNKWSVSGTDLTVTKENDSTTAWTSVVTASPGADPISGNDPA